MVLPVYNSIIMDILLNLSMTQFPHLWNEESNDPYLFGAKMKMKWTLSGQQISPNKAIIQIISDMYVYTCVFKVKTSGFHFTLQNNLITP